jgi:integrase
MSRGHIRRQGKDSWELKFDLGRDPLTGRRVTKFLTVTGSKKDAVRELTRILAERDRGGFIEPSKLTVAEYLRHWLESVENRVSVLTAARYRNTVEKHIVPRLGFILLRKLAALHVEQFEAQLLHNGRVRGRAAPKSKEQQHDLEPRGLSAQTVLHVHKVLTQALGHAVRLGVLFRNPATQVKPPRPPAREIKILTKDEIGALLTAAQETGLHLLVLLAITTGARRNEILALRWSDIDLVKGSLTVNQSLEQIKGETGFKAPKTRASRRTITLPAITVQALKEHKATQAEERLRLGLGRDPRGLVFTRPDGESLNANTLTTAFGRLVAAAHVTPISFHGLRHTHISHLLMDGVHLKVVSERAGHASVSITLAVYAAYIPNMQADAAMRVDAWLRPPSPQAKTDKS